MRQTDSAGPKEYKLTDSNDGEQMWEKLIKPNPSIILVVCGHRIFTPTSRCLTNIREDGSTVAQLFINHQNEKPRYGNGYLALLRFQPSAQRVSVTTYSPYLESSGVKVLPVLDPAGAYEIDYSRRASTAKAWVAQK